MQRVGKVVCLKNDGLTTVPKLLVKSLVLNECLKTEIKGDEAKSIHRWTEVRRGSVGMLKMPVPCFSTLPYR